MIRDQQPLCGLRANLAAEGPEREVSAHKLGI